jgi:hypothetical protein
LISRRFPGIGDQLLGIIELVRSAESPTGLGDRSRVLCEAGGWLQNRDPRAADRFYKALVRRCGRTPLGALADRLRWFPTAVQEAKAEIPPG